MNKEAAKKKNKPKCKGNKKAPVGSPRQNSFCKRMCSHKKKNTKSKTKKDPDSCINQALRRWKCRCSSMENLLAKIAINLDGVTDNDLYGDIGPADALDIIKLYRELYNHLQIEDGENSLKVMETLNDKDVLDGFTDYAEGKTGQLVAADKLTEDEAQEELDEIQTRFLRLQDKVKKAKLKPSLKVLAKLDLNVKDRIVSELKKAKQKFETNKPSEGLKILVDIKSIMFPETGDAAIDPNNMTFDAIDFFADEEMWKWIIEASDRELSSEDEPATKMISESIEDLLKHDIF